MNPTGAVRATDDSPFGDLTCPICGEAGVVTYDHHDTFEYGSGEAAVTLQVEIPIRRCEACDFEFLDQEGEQLKQEAVCRHLGVLTSTEIRQIRKRYGMTRSSFSQVTGLGEATLNRWENGVLIQNRANDRYLRLLAMRDIFDRLSHLPDCPFPSQEFDPEVDSNRQDLTKAAVPVTRRPPIAAADVHRKSHGGWRSPEMTAPSKQMTLFPQAFPRKIVKGTLTPTSVVQRATRDREHAKPAPPVNSTLR